MRTVLFLAFSLALSGSAALAQTPLQEDRALPAGIQGQNITDVKPEIKRDASSEPGYMQQNNGQRNAVQPGNNSPMWRGVAAGAEGTSTLPAEQAPEAGVLIQRQVQYPTVRYTTAGEAWRQVRNSRLIPYGGALLVLVLGAIAIFHLTKGPIGKHQAEEGGQRIERFTPFERSAHWANAAAFCVLAVSGLVMAFGRFLLMPLLGGPIFGALTYALKTLHNLAGPVFAVSLAVVFFTFLRHNWPQRGDLKWLLQGGGMVGRSTGHEPPSHRFNAGEKLVFWGGVTLLGAVVVASGMVMDKLLPGVSYDRGTMQVAHMVHNAATVLMMCVFAGHIYIGTIGMRGAYTAMRRGWVGDAWAREHHAYWYQDIRAGNVPAQRSGQGDPGVGLPATGVPTGNR
ncbi:MAG: putative formate dehydrogenase subunit precursor [Ramlibacter sp.]|nr:putative formate dehydrogenase subunit precursor [Ramlibacter sp.]